MNATARGYEIWRRSALVGAVAVIVGIVVTSPAPDARGGSATAGDATSASPVPRADESSGVEHHGIEHPEETATALAGAVHRP